MGLVVQKKASSNGFSIGFPMSKEIENEKVSSNGSSVSFRLIKEEEVGNKKASSNGISISFPMEAEMERYSSISSWIAFNPRKKKLKVLGTFLLEIHSRKQKLRIF